jgi:hypothetical protein
MGISNHANLANVRVDGDGSIALFQNSVSGSSMSGMVDTGALMFIGANTVGANISGIASGVGLTHLVSTDGSSSTGINNKIKQITPERGVLGSDAKYSVAMGDNALAYMRGSMAHSSFVGSKEGDAQYLRILLTGTADAGGNVLFTTATGDSIGTQMLPYDGYAVGTFEAVSRLGSYLTGKVFINTVTGAVTAGVDTVIIAVLPVAFKSPAGLGLTVQVLLDAFQILITGAAVGEVFCGTLKLTMMSD